jgi:DNA-binding NtrC family response regulator
MARIIVVDDERHIRDVVVALLSEQGYDTVGAESGEEAVALAEARAPDLVLLDLMLGGMSGLDTFKKLKERCPATACIFMTGYGSIRSAVDAIRAGGDDYLTKPFDNDEIRFAVNRALELRRLSREVEELRTELNARYGFDTIVGISRPMQEVFRIMKRLADKDATVLILGESGTGKELVARAMHQHSGRRHAPFVAVNCSAIPSTLVEAEFFGHERGAFTDAKEAHAGKFEQAHKGTLFLDEVGDLPIDAQAKLLRVLQDREVTRLGARKGVKVDVRVLAATNKNLELAVRTGQFREDLYWRLNVMSLKLPPLRDRPEDLPLLIDAVIQRLARDTGLPVSSLSPEARRLLLAHDWPGNVRELENTLQRAMVLCEGTSLLPRDLPPRIRGEAGDDGPGNDGPGPASLSEAVRRAVERVERTWIQVALSEHRGNRTATADSLGINRKTLFNKMRLYDLLSETEVEPPD